MHNYLCGVCQRPWTTQNRTVYSEITCWGGGCLVYEDDTGSPAASMIKTKTLLNSIIYDAQKGARFMSCNLKYFFLTTPMLQPEYMKTRIEFFPQDMIEK